MSLHQIDLTTALRPALLPDEVLLFVQDAVGLYEGKFKIPDFQNGQAYLTSHRACYIDNDNPRQRAVAVHLKDIERSEFYAGFLKSSPKVSLYPKAHKRHSTPFRAGKSSNYDFGNPQSATRSTNGTPLRQKFDSKASQSNINSTWICPICSFSNPVPIHFEPVTANASTPLPSCENCGMKPPLVILVKAALASLQAGQTGGPNVTQDTFFRCPRCTFENEPSLLTCEMCGGPLIVSSSQNSSHLSGSFERPDSPGPILSSAPHGTTSGECIKFSFRAGGEKIFLERLKGALIQRKWLLEAAPPVPRDNASFTTSGSFSASGTDGLGVGIAGLEQRGLTMRKQNELVIGNAFEDLAALMSSAKEIIELAERFAAQTTSNGNAQSTETSALLSRSASALNLFTTKDMLNSGSGSETLYLSELSRNLAEFLTDDSTGILKHEGGIMSLVDLWAVYNRARGGVELVSPSDFRQATELWDKLKLPIRLRVFKSGLLVVQARDRTDDKTIASIMAWLAELRISGPPVDVPEPPNWDWMQFGRGVNALEAAEKFGWSVGVASEELEMAEERGALCRDVGIEGVTFWENWILRSAGNIEHGRLSRAT